MTDLSAADAPLTSGRQYHIALERGELAEYVLLVGDPGRVAKVAERFDAIELERTNREFASATGTFRGMRVSVISTGIGTDNVEIVLAEVMEITDQPTLIRIGSSGALLPEMWEHAQPLVSDAFSISLEDAAAGVRLLLERGRIVGEGAAALPVAAAIAGRAGGGRIVCMVSGGNIDPHRLAEILEGRTPD